MLKKGENRPFCTFRGKKNEVKRGGGKFINDGGDS